MVETGDDVEKRRLSAAGGAKQPDDLANLER
jgi:hypothetical protein